MFCVIYAEKLFWLKTQLMDAKEEKRKRDRERYARLTNEQKKERLRKQREAYQRNKTIKEAKKNTEQEPEKQTEEEVERQRKPVTPGERQTLLHRRNEEFSTKQRKSFLVSSQEVIEPQKHPQVLINGNTKSKH
jgi:hypothetical protein